MVGEPGFEFFVADFEHVRGIIDADEFEFLILRTFDDGDECVAGGAAEIVNRVAVSQAAREIGGEQLDGLVAGHGTVDHVVKDLRHAGVKNKALGAESVIVVEELVFHVVGFYRRQRKKTRKGGRVVSRHREH